MKQLFCLFVFVCASVFAQTNLPPGTNLVLLPLGSTYRGYNHNIVTNYQPSQLDTNPAPYGFEFVDAFNNNMLYLRNNLVGGGSGNGFPLSADGNANNKSITNLAQILFKPSPGYTPWKLYQNSAWQFNIISGQSGASYLYLGDRTGASWGYLGIYSDYAFFQQPSSTSPFQIQAAGGGLAPLIASHLTLGDTISSPIIEAVNSGDGYGGFFQSDTGVALKAARDTPNTVDTTPVFRVYRGPSSGGGDNGPMLELLDDDFGANSSDAAGICIRNSSSVTYGKTESVVVGGVTLHFVRGIYVGHD